MASAKAKIGEITRKGLQELEISPTMEALITDVTQLASYNWIEAKTPTIAVPGCPALWAPFSTPRRLKQDTGHRYIAQNAARHPASPLEPLFRALFIANPSFDIASVDVVTDRNNIRKLLSFVNPTGDSYAQEAFTIDVEVTGNTIIFCRSETATEETIGPKEFRGYGKNFEAAYTDSQVVGSTGHHRIISYRFGGLHMVLRHETDGYVDEPPSRLANLLESMRLNAASHSQSNSLPGSKLTIQKKGRQVPLNSTLEIKTRVHHKPLEFRNIAPQLWISQTPKLVRAYHNRGKFSNPQPEDVTAYIKQWEKDNVNDLNKLAALLQRVVSLVEDCDTRSAVLRFDPSKDKLEITRVDREPMLPSDLYAKWDKNGVDEEVAANRAESEKNEDSTTASAAAAPAVVDEEDKAVHTGGVSLM
ncbi:geranylgeranyl pyrophosphate synthetase [Tothia fuscella]|uniref:Geranylgeranyl pyrophosphate synthetase n=1 Tax=Tothia fuscella TaxID=1048955 RepID=A0A9P4TSU9_9PEZI|nr:geranylgeranyl pyrophosphate synthetase [Tothia fuscella]